MLIPTNRSSIEIANSLESLLVNTYPQFWLVKSLGNENAVYSTRKLPRAERKARHRRRVRLLRRRTDFSNLFVVRCASYVVVKARYSYFRLRGAELE